MHAQTAPAAEPRLALVIGNGAYRDQPLKNPVNDAKSTAASLRKLGFTVIERIDAGKTAMEAAILEFGEKLRAGGVGLFYYAGHGIQSGGRNYLLPVDVTVTTEASVRVFGVEASLVMDLMSDARNRANVVILDACRNNPFVVAVRGMGKGLAAIDAARGTLIAYSTAPGMVAVDGDGANSPYTAGLLKALDEPGLKAEELFKRVRVHVAGATKGAQTPWESSSLTGDLVLNLNITINTPAAPAAAVGGRDPADVAFWNAISASNDPHDFRDYLKQFPNGIFSGLATRRLAELDRRQQAAEAEKQRLAALEAERQKKAAGEAEKKRQAAEEVARQKQAALEAERQKKAAEEAARRTQQAALPPPSSPYASDPRQRAYDRVMGVLLNQTAQSGTDTGKRNDYRGAPRPKAIAACLGWPGGTVDGVTVGAWASSWLPPGGTGIPPREDALKKCERGNNTPNQCKCAVVDVDDANVLELPKNVAVASAAPVPPAATQQAALPAPSALSSPTGGLRAPSTYRGTTKFADVEWVLEIEARTGEREYRGQLYAYRQGALKATQDVSLQLDGTVVRVTGSNVRGPSNWKPDVFKLTIDGSKLVGETWDERGGTRETVFHEDRTKGAATQQAALPPPSADPKAKWDGTWKVWLKRRRGDYNGTATIKNGHISLNAQADIYQMIAEGDIGEDGSLKLILKFRNQPETYNMSATFKGDVAEGEWGSGNSPVKFTRQ